MSNRIALACCIMASALLAVPKTAGAQTVDASVPEGAETSAAAPNDTQSAAVAPTAGATSAPTATSASTSKPLTPTIKTTAYVETFYQLNFNHPSNLVTAFRGFDNRTNSFTIDNAVLDLTGTLGDVSTRLALQVGHAPFSY